MVPCRSPLECFVEISSSMLLWETPRESHKVPLGWYTKFHLGMLPCEATQAASLGSS